MTKHFVRRPLKRAPTHPGAILREDTLPALGLSVTQAAQQLRISRQMLHAILAERSAVSPEMALRLGRFCGNGAVFWLRLQATHDLWAAEQKLGAELRRIRLARACAELDVAEERAIAEEGLTTDRDTWPEY